MFDYYIYYYVWPRSWPFPNVKSVGLRLQLSRPTYSRSHAAIYQKRRMFNKVNLSQEVHGLVAIICWVLRREADVLVARVPGL